jgi:hypothetical protein
MARAGYWLTPPTRLTFIVSVVLMILVSTTAQSDPSATRSLLSVYSLTLCALPMGCRLDSRLGSCRPK